MLPLVVLPRVSLFFSCFLLVPLGGRRQLFFWEVGYLCVVVPFLLCAFVWCVMVVLVFFSFVLVLFSGVLLLAGLVPLCIVVLALLSGCWCGA